mmetsp:Transcript_50660/g.133499  ORF Transcript_50660/g.133499 Transcript_50660/m.133499 type:complete len:242 (-) Transcript_50660:206-931(-)
MGLAPLRRLQCLGEPAVVLQLAGDSLDDLAPAEASVQRPLVHHNGILDVVPRIRHHRHRRVQSRAQLVEPHPGDTLRPTQRLLRVAQQVQNSIRALKLIEPDGSHGLLAHGTLIGIARGLVVIRMRHQSSHRPQQTQRVDLHVRGLHIQIRHVQGDVQIVFLVHINPFNHGIAQKIIKDHLALDQLHQVLLGEQRNAFVDHNQGPAQSSVISGNENGVKPFVFVDRHKPPNSSPSSETAQV